MLETDEIRQLDDVVTSLHEKFPDVTIDLIRQEVSTAAQGLADARVRSYIPLLVRHQALDRLRSSVSA